MRRIATLVVATLAFTLISGVANAQCGAGLGLFARMRANREARHAARAAAAACYSTQATVTYYQVRVVAVPQSPVCAAQPTAQCQPAPTPQAPTKVVPHGQPPAPPVVPHGANDSAPPPPAARAEASRPLPPPAEQVQRPSAALVPAPVPQPVQVVVVTDPYGYGAHLNRFRARFGLRPLRYDANMSAWAYQNSIRGFGHNVMVYRRQNAAWGQADAATVQRDWESSPGHADAMLDPYATSYGIAVANAVWTLNVH